MYNFCMDLASIGLSAVLSAILFIVLEFTIILPLFRKIVTRACDDLVQKQLIPSVSLYIDQKMDELSKSLVKSLYAKMTGLIGGRKKGVNSILSRLAAGEDLEDIEDEYQPDTIDKVYDIINAVRPYLPDPKGVSHGKTQENNTQKDKDSLQGGPSPFIRTQEIDE